MALAIARAHVEPVTVLGDLVHNERVLGELRGRGINIAQEAGSVGTGTVMITAHGASEKAIRRVRERGLKVIEATCPLVHAAHRAVAKLAREGYHPVIVGKRDHVEVRGLTEDLCEYDIVLSEADVLELKEQPRIGVAAQTTQPIEKVRRIVDLICRRFPGSEVRFVDTVCQPTKQRQDSAVEVARQADVVVVIGGANSNNTHELVETCRRYCGQVHHVQGIGDLRSEWFEKAETVGVTAGTSTPDSSIEEIERWLCQCARTKRAEEETLRPADLHRRAA